MAIMSEATQKFLMRVGERNRYAFKDSGKPTPEPVYDIFKVLSMLEVCLGESKPEVMAKVNQIAEWKP